MTLERFLHEVLRLANPPHESEVDVVHERVVADIWRTNPGAMPVGTAIMFGDQVLRSVARCHGAAMDGVGEPAGEIQGALEFDDARFNRLLRDGVGRDGTPIEMLWPVAHSPAALTESVGEDFSDDPPVVTRFFFHD